MKTLLAVVGCLLLFFAEPVVDREKSAALVERLGTIDDAYDRSRLYEQLFAAVGPQGIRDLQTHANDSIALQAAWKDVTLTVPLEQGKEVYRPGVNQLNWFLGYFEGRTRFSPPDWWREMLLDARANRRDNIYPGEPKKKPYHLSGSEFVTCPIDTAIEDSNNKCVISIGKEKILLPEELLDRCDDGSLCNSISGCFTSDRCFVTEHSPVGYRHTLGCVEKSTGRLLWKSEVCGCWWGGASGSHHSYVKVITTTDNRVAVFGAASPGFYFHCFRATDGKSLAQFSTNYAR